MEGLREGYNGSVPSGGHQLKNVSLPWLKSTIDRQSRARYQVLLVRGYYQDYLRRARMFTIGFKIMRSGVDGLTLRFYSVVHKNPSTRKPEYSS